MNSAVGASARPAGPRAHPRTLGWLGTTALAMGGSNQSLFLIAALFVGQGAIPGQGSAAIPLLILGLLLSWAAAPGWLELILLYPNRVGGIAATCAEAFKPYSPILANLTGVCYWWGWVPTCGLTALVSAAALHQWYLPSVSVNAIAIVIVVVFTGVNLAGVKWTARVALPIAFVSAGLAFVSSLAPVMAGRVDWHQAASFKLTMPFPGWFGAMTSAMAGLYLIGFAAPAFEAATCHVGETVDPERNVPKAMLASALMAGVFFIVLPVVWLGALGPVALGADDLSTVLGPTFAPVFGSAAKAAAVWFMAFNMLHGTLQPLAGAARTLAQLSDDGLLPEFLGWRAKSDAPWVATALTAIFSIWFLWLGDPIWLVASANFTYLIGIGMPNVAVWLLRRDQPDLRRSFRAPRGTILLGVIAAAIWALSAILGFQQFGLPTVLIGLVFAYSGSLLYAWRKFSDRRRAGLPGVGHTLHIKLTGAMLLVLALDGAGYLLAVNSATRANPDRLAALADIFVAVAMLTITVGLVLPGMIAHSAVAVSQAAHRLATGTLADFSRAMQALGRGDLEAAHARVDVVPVAVTSRDELGEMSRSFNILQDEVARGAAGLDQAREGLQQARDELTVSHRSLEQRVDELAASLVERARVELELRQAKEVAEAGDRAKTQFLAVMSHEIRTPMNGVVGFTDLLLQTPLTEKQRKYADLVRSSSRDLLVIINDLLDYSKIEAGRVQLAALPFDIRQCVENAVVICRPTGAKDIAVHTEIDPAVPALVVGDGYRVRQVMINLLANAFKFTSHGSITVRLAIVAGSSGVPPRLRFSVTDTGIGIPSDRISALFKPFSQLDASNTRAYGGTGLGLAICKNLVTIMGGEVAVESEPGVGSMFSFTLPMRELAPEAKTAPAAPSSADAPVPAVRTAAGGRPAADLQILVVEDIPVNLTLALTLLMELGFNPESAKNGRECLEMTSRKSYDLVFMDLQMPEMDGLDAAREIRRRERAAGENARNRVHICALTANVMANHRDACAAAGMDQILAKPLQLDALRQALERVGQPVALAASS